MLLTRRPQTCPAARSLRWPPRKCSMRIFRASSLPAADTASSRSRISPSAPVAAAFPKRSGRLPGVKRRTRQSPTSGAVSGIAGFDIGRLRGALVDEQIAPIREHELPPLVVGARVDGEDAFVRPRLRLALVDDGRLGLGRTAGGERG